ncbi:hypothetical protein GTCCBUS3UF5_23490 [Geobacillus thermoleovorans CCB_US3_UF5]|uniref:Uncharacterized protein n=1 Tax=Geobacillus thermoleovorans CCB_US3_UF5 TaxID=1111068 RepID=A0ABM5MIV0_GEOTH|nr:hypothetical protein GTCCBUS3UF5_23490 [Geobacillus thermoleovorans CCB_US3_UF5]
MPRSLPLMGNEKRCPKVMGHLLVVRTYTETQVCRKKSALFPSPPLLDR